MKKRKMWIIIAVVVVVLIASFIVLTQTDITKGIAYNTALSELSKKYPDFGEIAEKDTIPTMEERFVFPKYKLRSYTIYFINEKGDRVLMDVSSYNPFRVFKTEFIEKT